MRAQVTGTFALAFLLVAIASGHAQVSPLPPQSPPASPRTAAPPPPPPPPPPAPGFVSTYEIVRTLRSAGFDPLAPPLREGTIYVARATDYRGILMRVVLDARTGAIRDANRIVPGPGNYAGAYGGGYDEGPYAGPYGPDPYGPGPYGPGPYGPAPGGYGRVGMMPPPYEQAPQSIAPPAPAAAKPPAAGAAIPPLPRPRPPELASRKPADDARPRAPIDPKPAAAPPVAPTAAAKAAPAAPANPGAAPSTLSINN